EVAKLNCTADTNLSSFPSERNLNYGASSHLRLKGVEMMALFRFDLAPVQNWKVDGAWLYLRYAGEDRKLRVLGFSTVAAPWQEGDGAGEKKQGEVCFGWRKQGIARWAGSNTDFTDVSYTAGHTLTSYSEITALSDGWIKAQVDGRLVQALIAGASYGLAVSDETGETQANNDVFSREQSGCEPYLVVQGHPYSGGAPAPPATVQVTPDTGGTDFNHGAAAVAFRAPADSFSFGLTYRIGTERFVVERSAIPFARPGSFQQIVLKDLPPSARLEEVQLAAIGITGLRNAAPAVGGVASAALLEPPAFKSPQQSISTGRLVRPGKMQVWAYPDTEKANPINGNLLEEVGHIGYAGAPAGIYRDRNSVWRQGAVRLFAARKEIVAFQIVVASPAPLKRVTVSLPAQFSGPGGAWPARTWLFRDWYLKTDAWYPEVCIPLTGPFELPEVDNHVPGQTNQSLFVDLYVPGSAAPGRYRGQMRISAAGVRPISIPIDIEVNRLTLPDTLSFDISLNNYGTVGYQYGLDDGSSAYRAVERRYFRMAQLHRATYAPLGYSHGGTVSTNYAPALSGQGTGIHVQDWTAWDRQFGPYLDGSAFRDLPRSGTPISHLYLPFHEAWPSDIRRHYNYRAGTSNYPDLIVEHALKAPPIEEAMDETFREEYTEIVREFAQHLVDRGWLRTSYLCYQNDKYFYKDPAAGGRGTSWWLLDEPQHRDDWLALAFLARLAREGLKSYGRVPIVLREDVSRPEYQRNYLDGLVDLMVVSDGSFFDRQPLMRRTKARLGVRYWTYGSPSPVDQSNLACVTWALRAWLGGADGIVPWLTVGEDSSYEKATDTALMLPGKRFGREGPVASLRLKALRRAEQDVEYLKALAAYKRWNRRQVAAALRTLPGFRNASSLDLRLDRAAQSEDMRRAVAGNWR
ncbi:MAG TPA: hypothetical protein VGS41_09170, partial [Chthonomonadales bacterium]|nr:hypothetical protein [Chthonomonadales bacterium]